MRYSIPSLHIFFSSLLTAVSLQAAQLPATVTLGNLLQTYNGSSTAPSVVTSPAGLPVQVTYRNLAAAAPAATSEVVFNDSPDPLDLSYFNYHFEAQAISALGNYVQLGRSNRKLESCEVILVTKAPASAWPTEAAANPDGYSHPVTITIYEVNSTNQLVFRTEATQSILVPWRPVTKANGAPYPFSGYAFRATIPFPNGIVLPARALVMVSFNTQHYGFAPTGVAGPYNSLTVAAQTTSNVSIVGSDVNPDMVLQVINGTWAFSSGWTGISAPMLRINALSTDSAQAPVNAGSWQASARVNNADYLGTDSKTFTIQPASATVQINNLSRTYNGNPVAVGATTSPPGLDVSLTYDGLTAPPVNAGTYPVNATIANPNYVGTSSGSLVVSKAAAAVSLSNLVQIADGSSKAPTVVTTPSGLGTASTYNGITTAPSALGKYTVITQVADPNFEGSATGELWLGQNLQSWIAPMIQNNSIPADAAGPNDDPDHDSIPNLLEYAFGLNPAISNLNLGTPVAEFLGGQLSLIYRRNLDATDLLFEVEATDSLGGPESWNAAATTETVLSTEGSVQSLRASLPVVPDEKKRFARLKVVQTP